MFQMCWNMVQFGELELENMLPKNMFVGDYIEKIDYMIYFHTKHNIKIWLVFAVMVIFIIAIMVFMN